MATLKRYHKGFTLIEITMVLVIMGVLMFSLLPPLAKRTEQQRVAFTQQRLEEIKEALMGFMMQGYLATATVEAELDNHFPCPSLDEVTGMQVHKRKWACKNYDGKDGYLPWVTLGIEGHDGWGNLFRYRVDGYFSNRDGIYNVFLKERKTLPGSSASAILIKDRRGRALNRHKVKLRQEIINREDFPEVRLFFSNIVAVIFSCGKNGKPDEGNAGDINTLTFTCENNSSSKKNDYVLDAYVPGQFDDILVWVPKYVVINRLARAGQWPPAPQK